MTTKKLNCKASPGLPSVGACRNVARDLYHKPGAWRNPTGTFSSGLSNGRKNRRFSRRAYPVGSTLPSPIGGSTQNLNARHRSGDLLEALTHGALTLASFAMGEWFVAFKRRSLALSTRPFPKNFQNGTPMSFRALAGSCCSGVASWHAPLDKVVVCGKSKRLTESWIWIGPQAPANTKEIEDNLDAEDCEAEDRENPQFASSGSQEPRSCLWHDALLILKRVFVGQHMLVVTTLRMDA